MEGPSRAGSNQTPWSSTRGANEFKRVELSVFDPTLNPHLFILLPKGAPVMLTILGTGRRNSD